MDRLAKLHEDGNGLVGHPIKNGGDYLVWKDGIEEWRDKTKSYLGENYPFAVHERFSNVVVLPEVPFGHANPNIPDHGLQLSILVRQLEVLDSLRGTGIAL